MRPPWLSLLTFLEAAPYVQAQIIHHLDYGLYTDALSTTNRSSAVLVCNATASSANASGIYPFSPSFPAQNSTTDEIPDPAWAITVATGNNSIQQSLWYDTARQNYSDDLALAYDVCAFPILNLPDNTNRLAQGDNGNCSQALSDACRDVLQTRAEDSALQLTTYSTPQPYSNLSGGVLPYICNRIQLDILEDGQWPKECRQELSTPGSFGDAQLSRAPLTGYNASILNTPCSITGGEDSRNFSRVGTLLYDYSEEAYDNVTRAVIPVITVFFSVANVQRESFYTLARSNMTCLRAREFSEGSRVSPGLPAGTPYKMSEGLSGGAIAGIVVGVVVGVAVLAGLGIWLFLSRRKRRRLARDQGGVVGLGEKVPELDGTAFNELHDEDKKHEMDNGQLPELPDGQGEPAELESEPVQKK
ncbi:hypothetical protein PRZ48_012838 [Zasmidium cellare]|uniref:Uncharacterized protein n=1 Tax=Zasmidium cellare TaxID=395010 RepID=A0ABR0E2E2_ZASCE|nr:hypothetical protein PRZ48_012838 [Zasmidium cellare]